jgi:purine-binding chemotaxis protein CheW
MLLGRARAPGWRSGSRTNVVNENNRLVLFIVEDQKYALPLEVVDRVVRAVEVTPLPEAPPVIAGIFNLQGRPVPVVDLRRRFRLAERAVDIDDHFVVAKSATMLVAFPVDEALGLVKDLDDEPIPAADVVPDLPYVAFVVPSGADMVYVLDIDIVLTDDESETLQKTLDEVPE